VTAHEVIAIKVPLELGVVLEELVAVALLLAQVALVVVLVEVHVQLLEVVEAPGCAELAERVAVEAGLLAVTLLHVAREVVGREAAELGEEGALVGVAEHADCGLAVGVVQVLEERNEVGRRVLVVESDNVRRFVNWSDTV